MKLYTGKIQADGIALDRIHHGAGTSGNTSLARLEEMVGADGDIVRVPFISGASMRSMIRRAGVEFALEVLGVENSLIDDLRAGLDETDPLRAVLGKLGKSDGMLKSLMLLLMTGGTLTSTGTSLKLDEARKLEALFPVLALLGYASGNRMTESRLQVGDIRMVCDETRHLLPDAAAALPHAQRPARGYLTETFGTRRDPSATPLAERLLPPATEEPTTAPTKKAKEAPTQMIWDVQCAMAGTAWSWRMHLNGLRPMELAAFQCAMERGCIGTHEDRLVYYVGAKRAQGFGRMAFRFDGELRRSVRAPEHDTAALIPAAGTGNPLRDAYVSHLRDNRSAIVAALAEAAGE